MERFFKAHHALPQKPQGPLGPHFAEFAQQLSEQCYSQQSARRRLQLVAELSHWLWQRDLTVGDLSVATTARFLRARKRLQPIRRGDAACLKAFLDLLRRKGLVSTPINPIRKTPISTLLDEFGLYLQQERLLAPGTVANYLYLTKKFLQHRFGMGRVKLSTLRAEQVAGSVQHLASSVSRKRAKAMTSALRSFLRYARYYDFIQTDLAACVPCVADWADASIPKGLPIKHVNRVLASCDQKSAIGRRDYAVLLLLTRLGLRAGEVVSLALDDIDWEAGQLTVRGKGHCSARLPLPADVGKAIAAYLRYARPRSPNRSLFLKVQAPVVSLKNSASVGLIVRRALARAGIEARRKGAHLFRHSLATEMLRRGASLAEIGELLRHRSPQTTSVYAKVDLASLRTLALPWPGGAR